MAGRHRSDHVAIKVPDEPGPSAHSRHAGHALRGQSACPRPQYPTLRGNRTIKNEAKEKPRVGNIRFYPPATRRQANILHRTAKTCTSTPSANNFLPPRQLLTIALWLTAQTGAPGHLNQRSTDCIGIEHWFLEFNTSKLVTMTEVHAFGIAT